MLILDKRKAVERVVALTSALTQMSPACGPPETPAVHPRVRTYRRIATYERRAGATPMRRGIERRRRRMRLVGGPTISMASAVLKT